MLQRQKRDKPTYDHNKEKAHGIRNAEKAAEAQHTNKRDRVRDDLIGVQPEILRQLGHDDPLVQRQAYLESRYKNKRRPGLRKSAQMYKVRLSGHDYQSGAAGAGQTPAVLMGHYDEALEIEMRMLAQQLQADFYTNTTNVVAETNTAAIEEVIKEIRDNPSFLSELQLLLQNLHTVQSMRSMRT
jgi:hypothetical protein